MNKLFIILGLFFVATVNSYAGVYFQEALLPTYGISNPGSTNDRVSPSSTSFYLDTNTMVGFKTPVGAVLGATFKFNTQKAVSPETDNRNNNLEVSSKLTLFGPTLGFVFKGFSGFFTWFPFGSLTETELYGTNPVIYDVKTTYELSSAFQLSFGYAFDVFANFKIGPQLLLDWQSFNKVSAVYNKGGTSFYDVPYKTNKREFQMIPVVNFVYEI